VVSGSLRPDGSNGREFRILNTAGDLVAHGYDAVYTALPGGPTLRSIWREHAAGLDYPDSFYHISFLSATEMARMSDQLRLKAGHTLLDLGCGMAGPSLWIAQATDERLVGIDLSQVAIGQAASRAASLGLSDAACFQTGSFAKTGLEDSFCHAAMSVDALQYAPDKRAAFAEIARVLRRGSRFAFTAFEYEPSRAIGLPIAGEDPVPDYTPLLVETGFSVEAYDETPGWRKRLEAAYGAISSERDRLREEMGHEAVTALLTEVELTLLREPYRRRIFDVARRH